MFTVKSYQIKNRLLVAGSLLFGVLVYWIALSETISLYQKNHLYQAQLDSARTAPVNIARLQGELSGYENSLATFQADGNSLEEHLLQEVAFVCQQYQARLIQLPASSKEKQKLYEIETRVVKLSGSYTSLLQVLHALESKRIIGRISSVQFALEEDRRTRTTALFAYIYLQNIQKSENPASQP